MNSPDGNVHKRKREGSDDLGHDPQRMNRSSHGSNGSMPGDSHSNFGHSLNYEHGIPNAGSELNIDQQILQHVGPQNGMADDNALTANAKAALAAHTPQHKYPPPPDSAFDASNLTQGLSFGDDMGQGPMPGAHNHNSTAAAVYAAREAQSMNQKPTVGSPEWHQVRKNNHKEGPFQSPTLSCDDAMLIYFQWNVDVVRPSMKASTRSPALCQIATRTRAPYSSGPSSTSASFKKRRNTSTSDSNSTV